MNKRITFKTIDASNLDLRISEFFKEAGFKFDKKDEKELRFYQNDSIFEAWKINPLKWESEIIITIQDDIVIADFMVDTEAQMLTYEEEKVWNDFIVDFQNVTSKNIELKTIKINQINKNRKDKFVYFTWTIIGALAGGIIGALIVRNSESKMLVYFCIPIFATLFLKIRIHFGRHHNAL